MQFDVRAESVFEFVPDDLDGFCAQEAPVTVPKLRVPTFIGVWSGDDTAKKQQVQHECALNRPESVRRPACLVKGR